jgi:LPS-assembly protein
VTPQAGFRGDVWERSDSVTDTGDKYGNRGVFTLGTTLATEVYRVFDVKGAELEKIKHGIRPEITYTFIPEASQDHIPNFLSAIPAQNTLSYGITNTILTRMRAKDGNISYSEIMRFKLAQTYDIREARRDVPDAGKDNRPFGDVYLELDLRPFSYLSLSARNILSVNSGVWWQNNYDLALSDNRGDSAILGYRYTQNSLEEINLSLSAVLTSSLGATYVLRRNLLDRKTVESTYGLQYRKQCWNVAFNISDYEDDRTVMVFFSLYGLGEGGTSYNMGGKK